MIENTLAKIRDAENKADEKIQQAKIKEAERIRKFKASCDKKWEEINSSLHEIEAETITEYEQRAREKTDKIKKDSLAGLEDLDKLSSKSDSIIKMLIRDILKEKQ